MHGESLHVDEELADAWVGRFHWQLGVTIGAITLFDGYDVFNPSYVIHYVMQPWHLRPPQAGLLVSSGLVGFLLGAAAHGPLADRIGRRLTLLGGLCLASIFTLATAQFATRFASFCTLRLLTGLGLGVLLPLATTYINELAPRRVANTYAIWAVAFGWALGGSLAGVVGILVTPTYGWQSLYWIGGGLSVLLIPIVYVTLPESVPYLAMRAQMPQIAAILARLRPSAWGGRSASAALEQYLRRSRAARCLIAAGYQRSFTSSSAHPLSSRLSPSFSSARLALLQLLYPTLQRPRRSLDCGEGIEPRRADFQTARIASIGKLGSFFVARREFNSLREL
jgi:MFS family permease